MARLIPFKLKKVTAGNDFHNADNKLLVKGTEYG